jgi:hypothetical protein
MTLGAMREVLEAEKNGVPARGIRAPRFAPDSLF